MKDTVTATLPAGEYYIGDPCYAICSVGLMWVHGTLYGDGVYVDEKGYVYCVDSGQLGAILFKNTGKPRKELSDLGRIVKFDAPFVCSYKKGVFSFGHITIDTGFSGDSFATTDEAVDS